DALLGFIGASPAIERVRELVRTAARTEVHVLIEGETGTGKEVVARAIHSLGRRAGGPFVPVNSAAVPETLAESEFFGHARGAFTGAVQERPGVLQLADRGTLFLDEVEDLAPALQAKLLRVVQDREVRPLGASSVRRVDLRIVAAANRDLWRMVEAGQFRRDLYYRLRVFAITLPPLRQRREDLPPLIEHFIARVLDEHRWNRQRAATALGISRVTLWRRMERHGIRDPLGVPRRETA